VIEKMIMMMTTCQEMVRRVAALMMRMLGYLAVVEGPSVGEILIDEHLEIEVGAGVLE